MKILIAEDDPILQHWLESKLTPRGFEVHTVDNGDEALELWLSDRPWDVVLSDWQFIPGRRVQTGLDLVREIHHVDPNQRIIVHTSEEHLVVPHGVALLHKPYLLPRLLRYLRQPVQPLLF